MIRRRNKTYHCDFVVNGERYRQSLETTDRREAVQKERELIARARESKLASGKAAEFGRLPFRAAAEKYLAERPLTVQKETVGQERSRLRVLGGFFEPKRLDKITGDDIREYQARRLGMGKNRATVNLEVALLLRLLKRAKQRHLVLDDVKMLRVPKQPRQMLTAAEKQRVFETASSRPEWNTAYCAALLTANTSMRPKELKRLLWSDLDPVNRIITVRYSKTEAGTRVIPLNDEAWSAMAALKQRADVLGTYAPEWYIFHRQRPEIDPTKPLTKWRSAWNSLRREAAKTIPRLARLRFYDLRHQFVTELCEAGVPESVIRELAGHVDPKMMQIYSHPRMAARRAAVETLGAVKPGHVTTRVTKALPEGIDAV
jgi:integrase